jgi:hypothetical protein
MPSSDILQGHMTKTFYDFEDVLVYIDNILLFTKSSFDHHLQRLALVLNRIQAQNLYFLTTQQVDYLGYTLSSKGSNYKIRRYRQFLLLHLLKISVNFVASLAL